MLEPTQIIDEGSLKSPQPSAFRAVLKRAWPMDDSKGGAVHSVLVPPGTYELERVSPPPGETGSWLQLRGTTLGWPEQRWHDWRSPHYGTFQIVVTPIELSEDTRRTRVEALVQEHVAAKLAPTPLEIEDTEPSNMHEILAAKRAAKVVTPERAESLRPAEKPESEDAPTRVVHVAEIVRNPHEEVTRRQLPPEPMTATATAPGYARARSRRPRHLRFRGIRFRLF